jgi:DNA/RNA-binding domain of Phe-tRNA-synthetase-like protein
MREVREAEAFLAACTIDAGVRALRPDYRALLLVVDGLVPGDRGRTTADRLVSAAEHRTSELLAETAVDQLPHIAAWRDAYRAFGAKPQRTRNSLEALTRRAAEGLPRVNALTDVYNSISVLHQVPLGGEDRDAYVGAARLTRAVGDEPFDTTAGGLEAVEHPEPGEVVWRDDAGITCRRWNWRQGRRTVLRDDTASGLFILDALAPMSDEALAAAGDDLAGALADLGGDIRVSRRLLASG